MTRAEWPRLAVGAVLFAALLSYVLSALRVTTDITHFLPGGEPDSRIELARRIATGELSRTMVLLVETRDRDEAAAVSRAFEQALRAEPRVTAVLAALDGGPPAGLDEALWTTYQPRRFAFVAPDAATARQRIGDAGVAAAVATLKQKLASPMSGLVSKVAPADPFLVLPSLFERASGGTASGLGVQDDRFVTTDGTAAVLFLTTTTSASESTTQRSLLAGVDAAFAGVRAAHGEHLRLLRSGANRHAVGAEDSMRADIERVSIGSMVAVVLFYLLLFRSLRPLLICMPVLGGGFLAGTAACLLAFGEVHGLTLAFGSSLIGVAVDYSLHFHSHHVLAPVGEPRQTMRALWPSLRLSAATTIVAFVALLVATFPGLRELALFAATGIAAALLFTWSLVPGFAGPSRSTALARAIANGLDRALQKRSRLWLLPGAGVLLLILAGLPAARWDDSVHTLNRIDPALKAEDDAVHARVARFEQRRVVVVTGSDEQAALERNDAVATVLTAATRAGELDDHKGVDALLPSVARQRAVDAATRSDATLWPRLRQALTEQGLVANAFAPFAEALATTTTLPLVPGDLVGTPLQTLVRPFRLDGAHGVAFLTFLQGLHDEAALRDRLATVEGAQLLDIEGALTGALASYRQRMVELLLVGLGCVLALLAWRHRSLRATLVACTPGTLAALAAVAVLSLCGSSINLLSLVAMLMVVSMGDDYCIFLAADEADPAGRMATRFSILLAGLTTVLGFGLLSLSVQPALFRIGATSGLGILFCLLLSLSASAFGFARRS